MGTSDPANNGAPEPEGGTDRVLTTILARSLDRQVKAAERTADRVDALAGHIDAMGDRVAREIRSGMDLQLKVVGGLVALAIILLASVAGVQFSGGFDGQTVTVETLPPSPTTASAHAPVPAPAPGEASPVAAGAVVSSGSVVVE